MRRRYERRERNQRVQTGRVEERCTGERRSKAVKPSYEHPRASGSSTPGKKCTGPGGGGQVFPQVTAGGHNAAEPRMKKHNS